MVFLQPHPVRKTTHPQRSTCLPIKVNQLVITRNPKMCNFLEYKDYKIVYKRYASLYFITIVDKDENELIVLELMQTFVEVLDKYFGNVCELDLIFNFHKVNVSPRRPISSLTRYSSRGISASPTNNLSTKNFKSRSNSSTNAKKRTKSDSHS